MIRERRSFALGSSSSCCRTDKALGRLRTLEKSRKLLSTIRLQPSSQAGPVTRNAYNCVHPEYLRFFAPVMCLICSKLPSHFEVKILGRTHARECPVPIVKVIVGSQRPNRWLFSHRAAMGQLLHSSQRGLITIEATTYHLASFAVCNQVEEPKAIHPDLGY